ncbi:hypothetical protein AMEX_G24256 [Astyanax mexicanus]|uniref:Uncharacterized protein n=1 Tax=Astyanax mexicanus TaxID=7994 RepID=A0A8T2KXS3_ASTMX|nr:hypothetical protein AMEX_G24256 [Astyanax mexicanus]
MAELDLDHEELMPENCESNPQPPQTESAAAAPEDGTAAPSAGGEARCTASHQEMMDEKMQPIKEQLQYFLSKADEFQTHVVYSSDRQQRDAFARVVPTFLQTCQPYFTYLESTARNSSPGRIPLPLYIRTRLLQFSEQLCSRLEQLLLMYASFGYLSLEEADPLGISHFYIGQCQVDNIKLSIFRYCLPSPFLTSTDSGLYKRMRWNVERESGTESTGEEEEEKKERGMGGAGDAGGAGGEEGRELEGDKGSSTEYYFLCCEDVPVEGRGGGGGGGGGGEAAGVMRAEDRVVVRMWSIGQWVQTDPDPYTEDIYEWILCTVPQGQYREIVRLGGEEPSSCFATECLLGVLLSQADNNPSNTNN